ncbi:MAG: hypothetical protein GEV11_11735 [Streptosporangiales bacterium]|nr:hypothetical protein [Streptosporangiales bacterium]
MMRLRPPRPDARGPLLSLAAGALIVAALIWGPSAYGVVTAGGRIDPELRAATGPRDVTVRLTFRAEVFHVRELSRYGIFAGSPSDGVVHLARVPPPNLTALAQVYWVDAIEPRG